MKMNNFILAIRLVAVIRKREGLLTAEGIGAFLTYWACIMGLPTRGPGDIGRLSWGTQPHLWERCLGRLVRGHSSPEVSEKEARGALWRVLPTVLRLSGNQG